MAVLFAFPPRFAVQPPPHAWPLALRLVAAGRWPWPSDGNTARLIPPRHWRRLGSHLTPEHARGAGIWSATDFVRLQVGIDALQLADPAFGDYP
jgi:hypothetical protein